MRSVRLSLVLLVALLGCSDVATSTGQLTDPTVTIVGPLTFSVSDFPAALGVLWIAPTAGGARGAITATSIRYGGLCTTEVTGRAEITGARVALHVDYSARPGAVCGKDIRALRYDAVIAGLAPGRYDVHLLHSEGGGAASEVRVQQVDVT